MAANSGVVQPMLDLAVRYHQAGDLLRAEQLYRHILLVDPNHVDALHLLGLITLRSGAGELACDYMRQALRIKPDFVEAHSNLGKALRQLGRLDEAAASLEEAIRLQPTFAVAHSNLGNVRRDQGELRQAVAHYQEALRHKPDFADAYNNLGVVLRDLGQTEDAIASFRQALRFQPNSAPALANLGGALQEQGQLAEAAMHLEQAIHLASDYADAHSQLGHVLLEQGKLNEAAVCVENALRLRPDLAEAHYCRSMLWLLQGNFEQGWPEHEWRWQVKNYPSSPRPLPRWDGGPLEGKTILLQAEQGLGDTLQFIRYAAVLKKRGAVVVAECPPTLAELLKGCPGIDRLLRPDEPLPPCDVCATLFSMPALCGTTLATVPAQIPYLFADPSRVQYWQDRLAGVSDFKVGISWQGNPAHKRDRWRSVPLEQFRPLTEVAGVRLFCLQKDVDRAQWDRFAGTSPFGGKPEQGEDPNQSWDETAAFMGALDLVISVDTAVAHLAGALGVPVWVALSFVPDLRWMLEREDCPWYPTMRLFRQTQPGDWAGVFQRICEALKVQVEP